jgi:hypothetical protein
MMRAMRTTRLLIALSILIVLPLTAQVTVPRVSPRASVTQTIGTTKITVDYHRPGVKGRQIWGGLVPYDKAWRMGANEATTITFSDPVKVEGHEVPAGKYSFFAIPGRDKWTMIINKDPEQWGAFGYDPAKDQVRVDVKPQNAPPTEWMRFTIDPTGPASATVNLNWESVNVPMNVEVDVPKIVWKNIDQSLGSAYYDAASFALDRGERLDEALVWIDRNIAGGETAFNLWTKARLLQKVDRSREALPLMEKALTMARGNKMPQEFIDNLERTQKSIQADAAKK